MRTWRTIAEAEDEYKKAFTVHLDNLDAGDEGPFVTAHVQGEGAAKWARHDQSIEGAHWETDGDDFAYASFPDSRGLATRLEREGYDLDLDNYCPP